MLRDGRRLLLLILSAPAAVLVYAAATDRLAATWSRFGVPAWDPSFADMRAYTSGWECTRAGIDVFVRHPCDPWNRVLAPPRLPESLAFLGLGESSTVPLALAAIALFLVCVLAIVGPLTRREAVLYAAILCSPSILFGIERANTDLVVFVLLSAFLLTFRSASPWWRAVSYALLLVAAFLKLYPIAAALVLLRQARRRALLSTAVVLAAFAAYLVLIRDDFRLVADNMIRTTWMSYGAGVGADGLVDSLGLAPGAATPIAVAGVLALLAAAALVAARVGFADAEPTDRDGQRALDAYWVGASVFVATFMSGHALDYKFAALVLTVPQLLRWSSGAAAQMPHARWAIAALLATLWLSASARIVPGVWDVWIFFQIRYPFDELFNWCLFVYFASSLAVTAPQWLRRARTVEVEAPPFVAPSAS